MVVDHHVSEDDLGAVFLKDTTAEATGTLVLQAIGALGGTVTREVATGLLTAIAMDTGWFRHTNTRPATFRAAAELIDSGADIAAVYRDLFERNTLGRLRLMGATLTGLKLEQGGRVAYADDLAGRPGAHRGHSARFGRPDRFHGQPAWGRRGPLVHRAGQRRRQGVIPLAERAGLFPACRHTGRRRPSRERPVPRWPGRWTRRSIVCFRPSARPLIPARLPRMDNAVASATLASLTERRSGPR